MSSTGIFDAIQPCVCSVSLSTPWKQAFWPLMPWKRQFLLASSLFITQLEFLFLLTKLLESPMGGIDGVDK